MDRNDVILLAMAIVVVQVIASSAEWGDVAQWCEVFVTLGAAITALNIYRKQRADGLADRNFKHRQDQSLAIMQVASVLRIWLRLCASAVAELRMFEANAEGRDSTSIPPIELDLSVIVRLPVERAKVVYSILEQRERAIDQIAGAAMFSDRDEVVKDFFGESAKLFRRVRNTYVALAKETGLHPYTSQKWELDSIDLAAIDGQVPRWSRLADTPES